jgi:hypothetical protein
MPARCGWRAGVCVCEFLCECVSGCVNVSVSGVMWCVNMVYWAYAPTHHSTLVYIHTHSLSHSLSHAHTHSLSHSLTHTHSLSHSHTYTHSLSHSHTYTHRLPDDAVCAHANQARIRTFDQADDGTHVRYAEDVISFARKQGCVCVRVCVCECV